MTTNSSTKVKPLRIPVLFFIPAAPKKIFGKWAGTGKLMKENNCI
jgi:hypothetical protein